MTDQYTYEDITIKSESVIPRTQYYKLKISAHKVCDVEDFNKYLFNKKILIVDKDSFKNIMIDCDVNESYMLNENKLFLTKYGARYIGYSYFYNWKQDNHNAIYNYYFNIKNVKKFNYARLKIGF